MEEHNTSLPEDREVQETSDVGIVLESDEEDVRSDTGGARLQVAVVAVHDVFYGIRITAVREILRVPKITWVPWTPKYVVGILNVRGEILSIVDIQLLLRHGASRVMDSSRIVVVEARDLVAGLLVDSMVDIIDVPIITFQPLPEGLDHEAQKYLDGQFHWRDTVFTLLDTDLLLQGIIVNQG